MVVQYKSLKFQIPNKTYHLLYFHCHNPKWKMATWNIHVVNVKKATVHLIYPDFQLDIFSFHLILPKSYLNYLMVEFITFVIINEVVSKNKQRKQKILISIPLIKTELSESEV